MNDTSKPIDTIHFTRTRLTFLSKKRYFEMNPIIWTPNNGGSFLLWQNLQEIKK